MLLCPQLPFSVLMANAYVANDPELEATCREMRWLADTPRTQLGSSFWLEVRYRLLKEATGLPASSRYTARLHLSRGARMPILTDHLTDLVASRGSQVEPAADICVGITATNSGLCAV